MLLSCCRGLLIRGGDVLEAASQVDTVVFDKTGTLTQGRPCVQRVVPAPGTHLTAADLLAYAAAVERCTSHPVAQAIVQAAVQSGQPAAALPAPPPPPAPAPLLISQVSSCCCCASWRPLSRLPPPTSLPGAPADQSGQYLLLLCLLPHPHPPPPPRSLSGPPADQSGQSAAAVPPD